ncbi:dephospho-CoA kinase [Rhizodiscina lignyota]|uniref:Dephospho-CoA kinase n=1 Tax=Rhizodiscina lignyota TaxID=1504668 RepID=A0A9P4ICV3_9PEZI|nr:dephospho-CoA kinase [Rhizodiscina lignyota]
MLLLGLTGSIATGKSTVSNILRSPPYNLPIVDADVLARQVVEPGTPGYAAIVKNFGPTTPDLLLPASDPLCKGREDGPNGKGRPLNRPALGRQVFGDGEEQFKRRKVLNGIVHPEVRKALWRALFYYYIMGYWAVVLDIPLLFESGWEALCGAVLVVAVTDPKIQMQRLLARDAFLTPEDAQNRVHSQGDVREKARRAEARGKGWGAVVWNDGDREELGREVAKKMKEIGDTCPGWWAKICWLCPPVGLMSAGWCYWKSRGMQNRWEEQVKNEKAKL